MQVERAPSERVGGIFAGVFRELKPRTPLDSVLVRFKPYANGNCRVEMKERALSVLMSDIYQGAPDDIVECMAWMVLSKLARKPAPAHYRARFRQWMERKEMRRTMHLVRQMRGRKAFTPPQGDHYDLVEVFEDLNLRFFNGLMARPSLGWSPTASRTLLGHWDPSHNAIVISRILDRATTPREVVAYIMYHEMLHLRHPVEHSNGRRRIHTREFRAAEKLYPDFARVKKLLVAALG